MFLPRKTAAFATATLFAAGAILSTARNAQALNFNLTIPSGSTLTVGSAAYNGFVTAAGRWSSLFSDNITVNLSIDFANLGGSGIIGGTSSVQANYTYTNVKNALVADKTSADDTTATNNLLTGTSLPIVMNYTSDNTNGAGSATRYLDNNGGANNTTIQMTNANAKALGLIAGNATAVDATIQFNNQFAFDLDPTNGITSNQIDFVGVATHEIGHALGFVSGVDILDGNSSGAFSGDQFTFVSTLDLFRYSTTSRTITGGPAIDFGAGGTGANAPYFSLDRGITNLGLFSTGQTRGDGQQASHWKDNLGLGIMDPTADFGESLSINQRDIRAFDAIGYNLSSITVSAPEPGSIALIVFGLPVLGVVIRRRNTHR